MVPARRHHLAFLKTLPGELTGVAHAVADTGSAIADAISRPAPHTGDVSFAGDMREDADAMAECPFRWPCDRQRGGKPAQSLPSGGILAAAGLAARLDAVRANIRAAGFHRCARHPAYSTRRLAGQNRVGRSMRRECS